MRSFRAGMVLRGCYGRARAWTLSGKKERGKLVLELEFSGIQAVECLHSIAINWQSVNAGITRAHAPRAIGRSWRRFRWGIFRGIYLHYLSLSISARVVEFSAFGDAIPAGGYDVGSRTGGQQRSSILTAQPDRSMHTGMQSSSASQ